MRGNAVGPASGRSLGSLLVVVSVSVLVFVAILATAPHARAAVLGTEFQIQIEHTAHTTFALAYPGTYRFQIPSGASGLTAQYRYATTDAWAPLPTKTSADSFNGVPAARFDYAAGLAYVSLPFLATTDSVYVRIVDAQGSPVSVSYLDMPRYYDNRRAAVVITLDDVASDYLADFQSTIPLLVNKGLFHTVGVETGFMDATSWAAVRQWLSQGYTEAGSHTRTHPCTDRNYQNGGGYTSQISGSRDDLIANLGISYVHAFIQPCGFESTSVRQVVVAAHYLADRSADTGLIGFAAWSNDGAYSQIGTTNNTDSWSGTGSATLRDQFNAQFNSTYNSAGIYHLMDHPWKGLWFSGSYMDQHAQFISNRKDVWYAAFGALYQYHFLQERGKVTVGVVTGGQTPTPTPTNTSTPTPTSTSTPATPTNTPTPTPTNTSTPTPTSTSPLATPTNIPTPTSTPVGTLPAPSGVRATRNGPAATQRVNLTWTNNTTSAANVFVQRDVAANFQSPAKFDFPGLSATTTSLTDPGPFTSTTYYYRVYAKNASGQSAFSNTVSVGLR